MDKKLKKYASYKTSASTVSGEVAYCYKYGLYGLYGLDYLQTLLQAYLEFLINSLPLY